MNTKVITNAEALLDSFILDLEQLPLQERISINDYGKASIVIDSSVKPLALDAKKTISLAKNLHNQLLKTKRQVVTESFLKYFRLIKENAKQIVEILKKQLCDTSWLSNVPNQTTKKGILAITTFQNGINEILTDVNRKINIDGDKISPLDPVHWKLLPKTPEIIARKQADIKTRDQVSPSKGLFETIYLGRQQ